MENTFLDIYLQNDLDELIRAGKINHGIKIKGQQYISFENVRRINGSLGIDNPAIDSLGSLEVIKEDFWISQSNINSKIESLGLLKEIGGNASFGFSNIKDLGKLKKVGGSLILTGTLIQNLGVLESVGIDLIIPDRIKDAFNLSRIAVGGRVVFKKESKSVVIIDEIELLKSQIKVPFWYPEYIYSEKALEGANSEQIKFYTYFKDSFFMGEMIDLEGNNNYLFILLFDLLSNFIKNRDLELLKIQFNQLEKYYPITKNYSQKIILDYYEENKMFDNAWEVISNDKISLTQMIKYSKLLNKSLLNSDNILKLVNYSFLTDFGTRNIKVIKPIIDLEFKNYEENARSIFFDLFFLNELPYMLNSENSSNSCNFIVNFDYYRKFFPSEAEFQYYKSIDEQQISSGYDRDILHIVEKAIYNQLRFIVKNSEDKYRESIGMPKVGEGWISETELYYLIKLSYSELEVLHHASPKWLGRQHLDIYIPEFNIGIEYQGIQHYNPVDFFGGQEGYEKTVQRDNIKKIKCKENNCHLIYVEEGYSFEDVKDEIDNAILERKIELIVI